MRSEWKGTLYLATVKSALDDLYPVAFAITVDGEDLQGWLCFLEHLTASAPNLITEHFRRECSYKLFTFMSDRGKGLITALRNVFPDNHNCYCVVHIRRNVETDFGKKIATMVTPLSTTSSLPEKRALLTELERKSPDAYKYLTDIGAKRWMDSAWLEDEKLPPRYGFRNSNISESANNMLNDARNGNWLDAIDGILIKMSLRITKSQSENEGKDGVVDDIVGLATKRWEKCVGCRVYASGNDGETYSVYQKLGEESEEALLKVCPVDCVCDCGKWQAIGVPCVHGMAYFRHQMKWRLEDVFDQAVDEYHKYRTQRELYRRNFVPVWRHLLEPDMMTLPPDVGARRMPGRPKTVRLRKNSRYAHEPEKSPTICSRCHQPGHNRQTMSTRPMNFTPIEDVMLCRAYVNATLNPITGTDQKMEVFWRGIKAKFDELYAEADEVQEGVARAPEALMNRYMRKIQPEMNLWIPFYKRVADCPPSGVHDPSARRPQRERPRRRFQWLNPRKRERPQWFR
ncbi:MULE transposase domain containing protein [Nitzschia inconspicua]|uniref:MULE transposase domain containing protein n=1 Tax=Nitzschia inconspicua TaxID=303405 RepID=A0A9K3LR96_9STRA|nr:MULE transposase domain containing protein [Nitzschia inconspicua]